MNTEKNGSTRICKAETRAVARVPMAFDDVRLRKATHSLPVVFPPLIRFCLFACLAAILFLTAVLAFGQTKKDTREKETAGDKKTEQRRPVEILNLISNTYSVPPELAADVLTRIAQSKKVTDNKWKQEILEEAYRRAEDAQNKVRLKEAYFPNVSVDTRGQYRAHAFNEKLDALSLKTRVIEAMLNLNLRRAGEMLADIGPKLGLKPRSCEDTMVYEVSDFYQAVGDFAQKKFTPKEVEDGVRGYYLAPYIEGIESPVQLQPVLQLMLKLKGPQIERTTLENSLIAAFKNIGADDRSFSQAVYFEQLENLIDRVRTAYLFTDVVAGYRKLVVNNLQGLRCKDNVIADDKIPDYVRDVNWLFPKNPLTKDDLKETEIGAAPKIEWYLQGQDYKRVMRDYSKLRWVDGGYGSEGHAEEYSAEAKATPDWQVRVLEYLTELDEWNPQDQDDEKLLDLFHQKCVMYMEVLTLVGKTSLHEQVMRRFLQFLSQSDIQRKNVIDWDYYLTKYVIKNDKQLFVKLAPEFSNPTFRLYEQLIEAQP